MTSVDKIWGATQNNMNFPVLKFLFIVLLSTELLMRKQPLFIWIFWRHGTLKTSFILYSHFIPNVAKLTFLTVSVIYWCLKVQWIIQPLYSSCFAAHLLSFQSSFISKICSCFAAPISCLAFSKQHEKNNQKE